MSSGSASSQTWEVLLLLVLFLASFSGGLSSGEEGLHPIPGAQPHHHLLNRVLRWRKEYLQRASQEEREFRVDYSNTVAAAVLCFASASISSAGGVGGGALFLPILNLVAGLGLKTATTFSAFMVTGGAVSNVLYNTCFKGGGAGRRRSSPVDYDIALLSEPCMLLGVTAGVVCNVVFPEWLVTLLFVMLLAWSTFKTCRAGLARWKGESEAKSTRGRFCDETEEKKAPDVEGGEEGIREPLLGGDVDAGIGGRKRMPAVKKMGMLLASFFLLQFLRGDKGGKSLIGIRRCGVAYRLLTMSQVPLALLFTAFVLHSLQQQHSHQQGHLIKEQDPTAKTGIESLPKIIFPVAALLSGVLGGLFGIGGGLLMNPVLLQLGLHPQVTAATSSFMVLFSSSMSSVQYLMLGMRGSVKPALGLAAGSFAASLVGLIVIQRAVGRFGRPSIIIFSVSTVMFLSTVSMTCFGAMDVWRDYVDRLYMGFRLPC